MAMTRAAKIWIIILSIPAGIIICGVIAAKIYFTSDRLKAIVIPKVEESTHRSASVGDISLSFFPSLAVSLDNLRISNQQGTTFERNEFVSLENLRLKLDILPLLHGNLEISYIILNHPRIYLEVAPDGAKNFSSKAAAKQGTKEVESEKSSAGELLLSNLEINDGEVEYAD